MSEQIRGLQILTNGRNTGRAGISLMPGFIKGDLLVPFGWSVAVGAGDSDATIVANVLTAITTGLINNSHLARFQFIGKYITFDDKSEAPTMQKFNLGGTSKVNDGKYIHEYTYDNGGVDYHNAVRTYDRKEDQYKVIRIDGAGVIYGVNQYDNTGALIGFQGIELDNLNVYPRKEATFTTEAEYRVGYTFTDPLEMNDNMFAVATGINVFDLIENNLVVDITLVPFAFTATKVLPVMIKTVSGNVNLADTLGAALNDPTAIVAVNGISGVSVAVTSVALNPLTKKYVITFTTGAGYVATQPLLVSMGSVSALAALNAEYYDGSPIVTVIMT